MGNSVTLSAPPCGSPRGFIPSPAIGFKVPLLDILGSRTGFKVPFYSVVTYIRMSVHTSGRLIWQVLRQWPLCSVGEINSPILPPLLSYELSMLSKSSYEKNCILKIATIYSRALPLLTTQPHKLGVSNILKVKNESRERWRQILEVTEPSSGGVEI